MTFAERPSLVADHAFTTGQVPGVTFEKVLSPSKMKVGVEHGHGCYADKLPEDERSQAAIPDQFRHEIATAYNLKGKGLVVLTSCSHRGVVNIVKQAQAASGVTKVHAVLGGFHLAPYKEDYVRQVVAGLKEIDPDYVDPDALHGRAVLRDRQGRDAGASCCARSPGRGSCSTPERHASPQASKRHGSGGAAVQPVDRSPVAVPGSLRALNKTAPSEPLGAGWRCARGGKDTRHARGGGNAAMTAGPGRARPSAHLAAET